ncbi:MAG: hypothetical protein QJR01_02410 [Kyrpidia sp.]|nr:hypothetical protein [Kyrpidia sp.]
MLRGRSEGFILLEALFATAMAAVIWMIWSQWWIHAMSGVVRIAEGMEGEERWRRLVVRLSREWHDAGPVRGGGWIVEWRDGRGRWVSVRMNEKGQLLQSVDGAGDVVLANGLKRVNFMVESGGVTLQTWWEHPWNREPVTAFVASRRPDIQAAPASEP